MVDAGVLKDVAAVHGIHVAPDLPAGTVGTRVMLQPPCTMQGGM